MAQDKQEQRMAVAMQTSNAGALATADADGERVVATLDVGPIQAVIRAKDAARGAAAGMRSEIRAMVKAHAQAVALGAGLCTLQEIADLPDRVLSVKIAARKMGHLPMPPKA